MKKLLNTLYILSDDIYLSLENANIAAWKDGKIVQKIPMINLENIISFSRSGASPQLMGACAEKHIGLCFLTPEGHFLARINGKSNGNVFLRKEQYRISDDENKSARVAACMIAGKIYNERVVLRRTVRDHPLSIDKKAFDTASDILRQAAVDALGADSLETLRGIEGNAAQVYFSLFEQMILADKKHFFFNGRNKRPPLDRTNALLSFAYTILAHDCANALEAVGLDSYVGFLHRDRPGRISLALDLMEELRSPAADRFVLTLINNRIVNAKDFKTMENGAVLLNDDGRKKFLAQWQEKKKEQIQHPFLKEKIARGLIPYAQAMLLAKFIRNDLDQYPAFLGQ